jgi:hypothetical protein
VGDDEGHRRRMSTETRVCVKTMNEGVAVHRGQCVKERSKSVFLGHQGVMQESIRVLFYR